MVSMAQLFKAVLELITNSLTVVANVFSNPLLFLLQKCELQKQKLLTFFQQKISMYLLYFKIEILTSH